MLRICRTYGTKIWRQCVFKKPDGTITKATFIDLPKERVEDFVKFQMDYYVKEEMTHKISGIPDSEEALKEYKHIFKNLIMNPSCHNIACCLEDESKGLADIICAYSVKITRRSDPSYDGTPANIKTKEVKNFFEILHKWNNLCPIHGIMKKYDIQCYLDDQGLAVRPDYSGCGLAREVATLRRMMCIEFEIPRGGAWLTSQGSQIAASRAGWETEYEISREELRIN